MKQPTLGRIVTVNSFVQPTPVVQINILDGQITVDGTPIEPDGPDLHTAAIHAVAKRVAQPLDRPVHGVATDHTGSVALIIHPDGHASDFTALPAPGEDAGVEQLEPMVPAPPMSSRESRRAATRDNPNTPPPQNRHWKQTEPVAQPFFGQDAPGAIPGSAGDSELDDGLDDGLEEYSDPSPGSDDLASSSASVYPAAGSIPPGYVPVHGAPGQPYPPNGHYPELGAPGAAEDQPYGEGAGSHGPYPVSAASRAGRPGQSGHPAAPGTEGPLGPAPYQPRHSQPGHPQQHPHHYGEPDPGSNGNAAMRPGGVLAPRESQSFLPQTPAVQPAQYGWRGLLTKLGFAMQPSEYEQAERADIHAISRHWSGPRTIAIVNGKGGAGKTPATVILSALFATHGGTGVLAWDNNETRGTLGWRTEPAEHQRHVLDLLEHAEDFMQANSRYSDLAAYVHHQTHDKFEVLRSNPLLLPHQQRITAEDFDVIHQVMTRYYRLIFVDSGNDETAPHWLRMIERADQIVVATTTRPDHAEAGRLLLETLRKRDPRSAHLAEQAVVIVSQADREEASADSIADGFEGLAREAITIPYDKAMRQPWLHLTALAPATRRAYLAAAAAVSDGF